MAATDAFKGYRLGPTPVLPDGDRSYVREELTKLQTTLSSVHTVLKALEARIHALDGK